MTPSPMVVFVAANPEGALSGNERTLRRLTRRLDESDIDVLVARPGDSVEDVLARTRARARMPVLVHAFHARRSGPRGVEISRALDVPLVVGLTGTDLVVDIFDEQRAAVVVDVLRHAAVVTCGNAVEARTVPALLGAAPPCLVLPKGIVVPATIPEATLPRTPGEAVVLQVAHVRPVKNVALAVRAVRRLARRRAVRLVVLGDVLDASYESAVIRDAGGAAAWARMLHPAVPPEAVGGFLASADVVLNTSDGEGGSNAVLEAMACARAVVASAVPGNVEYLGTGGARGRTYPVGIDAHGRATHDEDALVETLAALLESAAERHALGTAARAWVCEAQSPEAERAALLRAYAGAAPASFPASS